MSKLRTANLLGALAVEIAGRAERHGRLHPNERSSATAALNVVGFYEGCSNGALSRALGLSHTATVRLVDKLEAAGLVISEPGADKRAVSLRLTDLGRERARNDVHERCMLLGDLVDVLTPSQQERLDEILETLLRSMVKAAEDADHICRLCDGEECPRAVPSTPKGSCPRCCMNRRCARIIDLSLSSVSFAEKGIASPSRRKGRELRVGH